LKALLGEQEIPAKFSVVVQSALREYLAARGYFPVRRRLKITPARKGSGRRDASVEHDRYLTER